VRDQIVRFGGCKETSLVLTAQADTQVWNGTAWEARSPAQSPSPRCDAAMAWDPETDEILLFGGGTAGMATGISGTPLDDTWSWNGTTWTPLQPAHKPPPRESAAIGFDAIRHRLVVFGGRAQTNVLSDGWSFAQGDWTALASAGVPPGRRYHAQLAWNGARGRLTLIGGFAVEDAAYQDSWELDEIGWRGLAVSRSPPPRGGALIASSLDSSGVWISSGADQADYYDTNQSLAQPGPATYLDTWRLRFDSTNPYEACRSDFDFDRDGDAGCTDLDCWASCTPDCSPGTICDPERTHCGDGECNALETCRSCSQDCTCTAVCGDFGCDPSESHTSCPGDCP